MPGPIAACAMSTGAMALAWRVVSAGGSSRLSARRNSARLTLAASSGRLRQTRTIEEASALVPRPIMRLASSVRIGHVPST